MADLNELNWGDPYWTNPDDQAFGREPPTSGIGTAVGVGPYGTWGFPDSAYGDAGAYQQSAIQNQRNGVDQNGWFNSQGMVPSRSPQMQQGMMPGYFGNLPQGMGMLSPAALAVLQGFFPMMNPNAPTQSYQTNPGQKAQYDVGDEKSVPIGKIIQPEILPTNALTSVQTPELYSAQSKGQAQSTGGWEALMAFMGDIIGQQAKQSWLTQSMAAQPSANKANQPNWGVTKQR